MLARCMATDAFTGMPKSAAVDQTSEWRLSSFGRFHRVRFSENDEQAFAQLESVFRPLVDAFFAGETESVYRSEMQLLNATPTHSEAQTWHKDNLARGVTVVVPLCDFSVDNGATQLLPGSHALGSRAAAKRGRRGVVHRYT